MRRTRVMIAVGIAASLAVAGAASAAVLKGAGKTSTTIIKIPANNLNDAKAAGSISSKPAPAKVGLAPTGGGSFAVKLAKDVGDPLKPGYGPGEYVIDVESSGTPTGSIVGAAGAAEFFIALTIDALTGKCTIHGNPHFTSVASGGDATMCGGMGQPLCATDAVGKCSATIYQVAGEGLMGIANPGDPFGARFRLRQNPNTATCKTGNLCVNVPPFVCNGSCQTGAVVGVGGVGLAPFGF